MAALERAEGDAEVKAVVLTGAGRAFCSGGDLQSTPPDDDLPTPSGMDVNMKIWRMPKPVIAAVRGYAVGQGHELAATCDMTIASEDAVFGELQIRHGFGPPVLMTPFIAGLKQAKEILLLGERLNAQDALRLGIVNRVVPAESLMEAADEMARKIAALPARTVQMNKLLVNRVHEIAGLQQALNYREDPLFAAMSDRGFRDDDPHLKVLREQGWEAFRHSRDVLYRAGDAQAEAGQ
jgi:enoyl-CoA hydratase/carnithine racemase